MDEVQDNVLLSEQLATAIEITDKNWLGNVDEHGGIIMYHPKDKVYKFMLLPNQHASTERGPYLWEADREVYAAQIIPMFKDGWKHYASYHTHPRFPPYPSNLDRGTLFPGFKHNYIYSGTEKNLMKYTWEDDMSRFTGEQVENLAS